LSRFLVQYLRNANAPDLPGEAWNAGRNTSQIGLKPVEVAEVPE
jgi:hypothetical protein